MDEVFTGFGRTGKIFASEDIQPHLLCVGKALGGGFPLSACVGDSLVMDAWPKSKGEAIHTSTFSGHPFSCLVAKETLKIIRKKNLTKNSKQLGEKASKLLRQFFRTSWPEIEIRSEGLMLAIDYKKEEFGVKMMDILRQNKIIALASGKKGECLQITPALNISEKLLLSSLKKICQISDKALRASFKPSA